MKQVTRRVAALLFLAAAFPLGVSASGLGSPKSKSILEVVGRISNTNKNSGAAVFDLEMLENLGLDTVTTTTPWHTGPQRFEGVRMSKLMTVVGAKGTSVKALALNDYTTQIPIADFAKYDVLLALKREGEYMPIRDKGPLFIIYPYDSHAELKSQTYYGRSAWQLKRLEVVE